MRLTRSGLVLFSLLFLAPVSSGPVLADEEAEAGALSEAEARRLRTKLRSRASEWWRRRKRMVDVCSQCKGNGQVRWRRGRRRVLVDCPKCEGHKIHVDRDVYRYCFYEARSPDFRRQEGIRARVTQEFVAAREGRPFPTIIEQYAIEDIELADATHGIVHVERNRDSVTRPQQWILAKESGKPAEWYLYDAGADGPWPAPPRPPEETPEAPVPEEAPPPAPPPLEVAPPPTPVPEPAPDPVERADLEESRQSIETWTEERNDIKARVIRIRLAIEDVEGHEETLEGVNTFLGDVDRWMEEEGPAYERAKEDVEERGLGVSMSDRLKINTLHFKANRRLGLIAKMLIGIVPDLDDD